VTHNVKNTAKDNIMNCNHISVLKINVMGNLKHSVDVKSIVRHTGSAFISSAKFAPVHYATPEKASKNTIDATLSVLICFGKQK